MESGFTAIPNGLFEAVLTYNCPPAQKELIFALIRLTMGYQKQKRALSLSYIAHFLKEDRSNVAKKIAELERRKVIIVSDNSGSDSAEPRIIGVNTFYKQWLDIPSVKKRQGKKKPPLNAPPQKEEPKKEVPKKESSVSHEPEAERAETTENASIPAEKQENASESTSKPGCSGKLEAYNSENSAADAVVKITTPPVVNSTTNKEISPCFPINKTAAAALKKRTPPEFSSGRENYHRHPEEEKLQQQQRQQNELLQKNFRDDELMLDRQLMFLFLDCLSREANSYELRKIKEHILDDTRFSHSENFDIVIEAFERAAIVAEDKKTTPYLLGIIKSMKQDKLRQKEEKLKKLKKEEAGSQGKKHGDHFTPWDEAGFSLIDEFNKISKERITR
ncbi:MAG: replication protein [archaeon]